MSNLPEYIKANLKIMAKVKVNINNDCKRKRGRKVIEVIKEDDERNNFYFLVDDRMKSSNLQGGINKRVNLRLKKEKTK